VDELVSKHFAVLGTTGVGKSSGVAIILNKVMEARPDVRIFLLDGHNEYGGCFGSKASVISSRNLRLPFWLFNFEEFLDVVFGGRAPVPEEVEILSELIPIAKGSYNQYRSLSDRLAVKKADPGKTGLTVDTPVPYVLQDLLALIDERMGRLENRASRLHYHRLTSRIETIRNDPRYAFMFDNANVGGDVMCDLLAHLFQLDASEQPISIMQLAGLPVEVVDAVVCVLCRLAFDLGVWSEGAFPLLFVCEEAHRYAAADRAVGFNPTRRALSRIAKEGRKHGVFLGLVTQRPAELDPTIISQCSTLFGMRMANEEDQRLLRTAVSDASSTLMTFLPSLGTREVIGFGQGIPLPARLVFDTLPSEQLPRAEANGLTGEARAGESVRELIRSAVERWRGAARAECAAPSEEPPPATVGALEHARLRTLRGAPKGIALGGAVAPTSILGSLKGRPSVR
jgi:DNA helicase HerA-like ATPase